MIPCAAESVHRFDRPLHRRICHLFARFTDFLPLDDKLRHRYRDSWENPETRTGSYLPKAKDVVNSRETLFGGDFQHFMLRRGTR